MSYQDPDIQLELGNPNPDSIKLEEFTFHHGHVEKVINTDSDISDYNYLLSGLKTNISQIIIVTLTFEGNTSQSSLKTKIPCQPLLRGFSDSIATGDSVIYTNIGGVNYYLGPLNTTNNPNYTPDSYQQNIKNTISLETDDRKFDENGYNANYIKTNVAKHFKIKNTNLDRPYGVGLGEEGSDVDIESAYSDLSLEGRHNNKIAIGSRFINPYITIKNNSSELNNGSIIGLFSLGSLSQNEINIENLSVDKLIEKERAENKEGYIGDYIGVGNDSTEAEGIARQDRFNLNFAEVGDDVNKQTEFDQIIMFSDRITFDAQNNDLTMSALRNINVGSGQNISITSKKHTLIQSENIYLGKQSKQKTEPIVLGEQLRILLEQVLNILSNAHALVQGVPLPLVDASGARLSEASGPLVNSVQSLAEIIQSLQQRQQDDNEVYQDGVTPFLSKHHFIETNRS